MSDKQTIYVGSLTDDELLHLDGKCRDEVQAKVEQAKLRQQYESPLIGDIIAQARERKKLRFTHKPLRYCKLCKKDAGYVNFKSGPRKGQPNTNKPRTMPGYDFSDDFVTIRGHVSVGGCKECVDPLLPAIREALSHEQCELPDALRLSDYPKYRKVRIMHCDNCGWEGLETDMVHLAAMMEGTYPGQCPSCEAKNLFLGRHPIKGTGEHRVIEVRDDSGA